MNEIVGISWVYEYDRGGNILRKTAYPYTTATLGTAIHVYEYEYDDDNWKDKLTSFDGHTITYDAIGNPLNDGRWTYEWQAGRQLKSMSKIEDGATITMEFTYNHAGLRTKKVKKVNGVIEETTNYIWNGNHVVGLTKGNDVMHFYYDAQGRVSMVKYNGAMYTYVHNLQGDIVGIIDSNGTLIAEYKYDAWGKLISSSLQLVAELNPFRYRHYLFDEETCLYYLINRYYDPNICRFAITDNYIVNNQYSYCINNPIKYDDMDGNRPNSNDNSQGSNSNDLFLEAYKKTYKENYQCTEGYESFEVHIEPEDDRWSKHAKNFMNNLLCSIICTSLQIANQSTQILMGIVIGTAIGDVDIENGNSRHVTVTETSTFTMDIETANIHGYKLYKEEEFERIRISEYLLTDTGYLLYLRSYEATTYDGYLMRNHP